MKKLLSILIGLILGISLLAQSRVFVGNVIVTDTLVAGYISGGGGSSSFTNLTPTPVTIGGIPSGSTFVGATMSEMWEALLYPYQYPAFSSFLMSGQSVILECGVEISGGVKLWTWGTTNSSNIAANSIDIDDVTTTTNLITGTDNDGSELVSIGASPITKIITSTDHRWRITGENSLSQNFTRDFVVIWYSPFSYGSGAAGLTVAQLQALTKQVTSQSTNIYTFKPSTEGMYIAYPATYGTLSSILDPNGFETIADWTLRVESFTNNSPDYEGATVSYNVYEFDNLTTQTDFEITFIF